MNRSSYFTGLFAFCLFAPIGCAATTLEDDAKSHGAESSTSETESDLSALRRGPPSCAATTCPWGFACEDRPARGATCVPQPPRKPRCIEVLCAPGFMCEDRPVSGATCVPAPAPKPRCAEVLCAPETNACVDLPDRGATCVQAVDAPCALVLCVEGTLCVDVPGGRAACVPK